MKPLELRFQAFGPYRDQQIVNFRHFQAKGGLFLIHGPTGGGKTTLLDAICFALFGKASGGERSSEGLRSDLASGDLPTEVTFEFTLGQQMFRVVRRPRQTLARSRNKNGTDANALTKTSLVYAEVWQCRDGVNWQLETTGAQKSDDYLTSLIGMNESQFRQVVVLPQGQFRRFLAASSDEREALLERLFKTDRLRELEEALSHSAKQLERDCQLLRADVNALRSKHFSTFDPSSAFDSSAIEQEVVRRREELSASEATLASTHQKYENAAKSLETAKQIRQIDQELAATKNRLEQLNRQQSTIDRDRERLFNAKRVQPIARLAANGQRIAESKDRSHKQILVESNKLGLVQVELQAAKMSLREFEARSPEITLKIQKTEELRGYYANAKLWIEQKEISQKSEAALQTQTEQRRQLETSQQALENTLEELRSNHQKLALRASRLETLEDLNRRFTKADAVAVRCAQVETQLSQAVRLYEAHQEQLTQAKIRYHLAQAHRLAATLKDGEPCPVCGSVEHPKLAISSENSISDEQIKVLEHELQDHQQAIQNQRLELTSLKTELSLLDLASADRLTVSNELQEAKSAKLQLQSTERSIERAQADLLSVSSKLKSAQVDEAEVLKTLEKSRGKIEQIENQVPEEWRDLKRITLAGSTLKQEISHHDKALKAAQSQNEVLIASESASQAALQTLADEQRRLDEELKINYDSLLRALSEAGIQDLPTALSYVLNENEIHALDRAIRDYDHNLALLTARSLELEKQKHELTASPAASHFNSEDSELNLRESEHEFRTIEETRTRMMADILHARETLKALTQTAQEFNELSVKLQQAEQRFKVAGHLAEAAAGRAPQQVRINFQRFVLAHRLEEVLAHSSKHLHAMTRGQFQLRRADETVDKSLDKRKAAGLDLIVEDSYSGKARATSTLSGGEGFMASLALALGLADVVQSHLGGVRLDAVFIDEGFGTLDSEALELAIKTLTDLQAGGRLVGIISHVPELREQIAHRLRVRRSHSGSTIAWEGAHP